MFGSYQVPAPPAKIARGLGGPVPVPTRTSRTLKSADVVAGLAALLAVLAGFGILTPDQVAEGESSIAALATLVERIVALGAALVVAITRVLRWLRLAVPPGRVS